MKPLKEKRIAKDSEDAAIHPVSVSSGHMIVRQPSRIETSDQNGAQSVHKTKSPTPARKATGPRTLAGKNRAKHNALKYGIFSKVALLKTESRSEFERLLKGLHDDLRPEGRLQGILVENLAINLWRRRRLFTAEVAEIENGIDFFRWDETQRQEKELAVSRLGATEFDSPEVTGLIEKMENPQILENCLMQLKGLKDNIKTRGLNSHYDQEILTEIYGDRKHWTTTLSETYEIWSDTAGCSDEERTESGCASEKQCKINVLIEIDDELARLTQYKKVRTLMETERFRLESLRKNVPDGPQVDRLLQYEASLARDFERTLTQLERLQRMRRGQPVLPPIKVEVSSE
jgi:hypothetical protein